MDMRRLFTFLRHGAGLMATISVVLAIAACDNTAEGERCNPALSHDECSNGPGIQCIQINGGALLADGGPPPCNGEAYCCPTDSDGLPSGDEPNCQYLRACAMQLAGTPAPADAGTD